MVDVNIYKCFPTIIYGFEYHPSRDDYKNMKTHEISNIDLLKIDTEGHEKEVLEGALNLISALGKICL